MLCHFMLCYLTLASVQHYYNLMTEQIKRNPFQQTNSNTDILEQPISTSDLITSELEVPFYLKYDTYSFS